MVGMLFKMSFSYRWG